MKLKLSALLVLAILAVSSVVSAQETAVLQWEGVVETVEPDALAIFPGAEIGDTVIVTITIDPNAENTLPDPFAVYLSEGAPFGFTVQVGNDVVSTDAVEVNVSDITFGGPEQYRADDFIAGNQFNGTGVRVFGEDDARSTFPNTDQPLSALELLPMDLDFTLFFSFFNGQFIETEDLLTTSRLVPVADEDLLVGGTCPGDVSLVVTDVTPGGAVVLASAASQGSFVIPGGSCEGVVIDLENPNRLATVTADENGNVFASGELAVNSCGLFVQAIDLSSCNPSDVSQFPGN